MTPNDWQPIETAPKDYESDPIDLWVVFSATIQRRVPDCVWCPNVDDEDNFPLTGVWIDSQARVIEQTVLGTRIQATHWRPLPPPPQDISSGTGKNVTS